MSLLSLLLIPVVLAADGQRTINNYVVKITDNTLKSVHSMGKSSSTLDLSGLGLRDLDKDAFDNLANLKNLSLAKNSLSYIPNGLFSGLSNLEDLILSDNDISVFKDAFVGLDNLKTLDISNNPLPRLGDSELYGLSKSAVVFTKGLNLIDISSFVFERTTMEYVDTSENSSSDDEDDEMADVNIDYDIKVCIRDDILLMVEPLGKNEVLINGCSRLKLTNYGANVSLENLGISRLAPGWCRLQSTSIKRLSLAGNKIVELTRDSLNDLPAKIVHVDLSHNLIERLQRGIIENDHIKVLRLLGNGLREIEDGALARTTLWELDLYDNQLRDTKFIQSLPSTLEELSVGRNRIIDILPNSFANLGRLKDLDLAENSIQTLRPHTLRGLSNLKIIRLSENRISKIQVGVFGETPRLRTLLLENNRIASFNNGTFDNLPVLVEIDLSYNRLTSMEETFPNGLPAHLIMLLLSHNQIEMLKSGDFVNAQLEFLDLHGNNISKIEPGAFNLKALDYLSIEDNALHVLDPDSFRGLDSVQYLSLRSNRIAEIPRHFAKRMRGLKVLDVSDNPIKRLRDGVLYGFEKRPHRGIRVYGAPVEIIHCGLFDE